VPLNRLVLRNRMSRVYAKTRMVKRDTRSQVVWALAMTCAAPPSDVYWRDFSSVDSRPAHTRRCVTIEVPGFVAPVDSRLPGGGGYTIDDLWEISSTKFGLSEDFVAPAEDYGKRISYWHGVDVNISGRMRNSLMFQGGTSTGRAVTDTCDVTPKLDSPSRRFCRTVAPFATQFKGLMSYTIPKVDVQVSSTIQSLPGASLMANLVVPSNVVAQTLGRPLAGSAASVTVNLIAPQTMFGDRINQVDFRIAKVLRFGRNRAQVGVDIFNAMNSNVPLGYLQTYGSTWLRPTSVLDARFARVSGQIDF
jgi:hypothetical protein